jgi:uncharacterized protein YprB with RNaseH-like and TPR domain
MPSLSDKLKALGVQIGPQNLTPTKARKPEYGIQQVLPGEEVENLYGLAYRITEQYAVDERYGLVELRFRTPPELIAQYCGVPDLERSSADRYVFIDTETTGLGLGSGIFAFLIGLGYYREDYFIIRQYFLRDPGEETAALTALSEEICADPVLVSFNGKAFDVPMLNNRYILNGLSSPFDSSIQLDLLHLSRRLWKDRLPSRTLINLEGNILAAQRTEEDVPGWMIPQLYKDYLHTGDARLVKNVFYHNARDILAMVGLLNYVGGMLTSPLDQSKRDGLDLASIGSLHERFNRTAEAIELYNYALKQDLPPEVFESTLKRLSFLHKQSGDWQQAISLWELAAQQGQVYACEELAKYYEHNQRDYSAALKWVEYALTMIAGRPQAILWQPALEHRRQRLLRKTG